MKTKVIIALVTAALCATVFAAFKCGVCQGSGWQGSFKCTACGGDGKVGD